MNLTPPKNTIWENEAIPDEERDDIIIRLYEKSEKTIRV